MFDGVQARVDAAAVRYALTPREIVVLGLVLDGYRAVDAAAKLHLAPSTVAEYVQRLIDKTGARNRTHMVALMLGWDGEPDHSVSSQN